MKKIFKILFTNLVIFICLIFLLEILIWGILNYTVKNKVEDTNIEYPIKFHSKHSYHNANLKYFPSPEHAWGREVNGLNYKEKPLVIFGCSYAYGYGLKENETISYLLSESTKRPVYNRANTGWGIQHMLYQVRNPLFYGQVKEPEYVIFIVIYDHFRRLYIDNFSNIQLLSNEHYLRYKLKDNKLVQTQHLWDNSPLCKFKKFISNLYIIEFLQNLYVRKIILRANNEKEYYQFALEHFIEAREEMQKNWSKTKYVVLLYNDYKVLGEFAKVLENNNFIVLDTNNYVDLSKKEYKLKDNIHPNKLAWEVLTPIIIKDLNL